MQFSTFALIASCVALVAALPECSYQCLGQVQQDVASTGCGSIQNSPCICAAHRRGAFSNSIGCVHRVCPNDQANEAVNAFLSRC